MRNCINCSNNNNAEWDERTCPFARIGNCIENSLNTFEEGTHNENKDSR